MYDTIIIGAGMSGLAAGIRLAHFGQRVCILERHSAIGGLNSFYRQGGRTFDVGLHAITNFTPKGAHSGPFARLLRQLRVTWEEWALAPQLGSAVMPFPGPSLQILEQFRPVRVGSSLALFPRGKSTTCGGWSPQLVDYDQFGQQGRQHVQPEALVSRA